MFTLAAFALLVCAVTTAASWALRLAFRLCGWALCVVLSVALLPLGIIVALVCGIAWLAKALVPILILVFVLSLLTPQQQ